MMEDEKEDKGYCGLSPLETGEWDPFIEDCRKHDPTYIKLMKKLKTRSNWVTQRDFTTGILSTTVKTVAKATYVVITAPVYIVIGAFGGALRYFQLSRRKFKP